MTDQPIRGGEPRWYLPLRYSDAWAMELYDQDRQAMGLAAKSREVLVFQTLEELETAAKRRGLQLWDKGRRDWQ